MAAPHSTLFKLSSLLFLLLTTYVQTSEAFFRMGAKVLVAARMDPLVSPNAVSAHMHNVVGGNKFKQVYDYDELRTSTCTSNLVSVDFSNYWAPGLYYNNRTHGTFTYIPSYYTVYYLDRNGSKKEKVHAWPAGLRMIAGDPNRRTYNASSVADMAVSYVCLNYNGPSPDQTYQFFKQNCPNGMRAQIVFPSCWNGKDLDSADHKSHMAYPVDGHPDSGNCPSTHPVRLVTLFYEQVFDVGSYPYDGDNTWAFSNGDTTGFGYHADFQNGWEAPDANGDSILQRAIDQCTNQSGELTDCPVLKPYLDDDSKEACKPYYPIPDEDVGFRGAWPSKGGIVSAIPGCNPLWTGTGSKPTCSTPAATPAYVSPQSVLPAGWTVDKCYTDTSSSGRALRKASLVDTTGMTRAKCAAFCESKGYSLAGVEWSQECYCDNALQGGSTVAKDSDCRNTCAGEPYENCGGSQRITLLKKGAVTASSSSVSSAKPTTTTAAATTSKAASSSTKPSTTSSSVASTATWKSQGCYADSGNRILWSAYLSDPAMTVQKCTSFCSSKGFTIAGIEYGSECWCDSQFRNGASLSKMAAASNCSSKCSGNSSQSCGGSWYMNVYTSPTFSGKKRSFAHRRHHRMSFEEQTL